MRTLELESPPLASQVVEAPPPEARLSGRAAPVETSRELSRGDARAYRLFLLIWAAANLLFWSWWLRPEHVETGWLYALFTLPFAYEVTVLPSVFLFYLGRM